MTRIVIAPLILAVSLLPSVAEAEEKPDLVGNWCFSYLGSPTVEFRIAILQVEKTDTGLAIRVLDQGPSLIEIDDFKLDTSKVTCRVFRFGSRFKETAPRFDGFCDPKSPDRVIGCYYSERNEVGSVAFLTRTTATTLKGNGKEKLIVEHDVPAPLREFRDRIKAGHADRDICLKLLGKTLADHLGTPAAADAAYEWMTFGKFEKANGKITSLEADQLLREFVRDAARYTPRCEQYARLRACNRLLESQEYAAVVRVHAETIVKRPLSVSLHIQALKVLSKAQVQLGMQKESMQSLEEARRLQAALDTKGK